MRPVDRRAWLRAVPGLLLGAPALAAQARRDPGAADPLPNPGWVGRPRAIVDSADNAPVVDRTEHRLRCTCGCGLDVFTCRTTDFTCTYSPKLHREVVALYDEGKSAQEILDAFVDKYGEKALMAPKPEGFNLAGYWLPGTAIAAAGLALFALISRRRPAVATAASAAPAEAAPEATPEELERLRRALSEVED